MVQIISVFLGGFGFGMVFHLDRRHWLQASLGGVFTYVVYLLTDYFGMDDFFSVLWASAFSAFYAEILARIHKAPASLYLIMAVLPLVPGSSLFYTMSAAVANEWADVRRFGIETISFSLGIAIGMSVIWALFDMMGKIKRKSGKAEV